MRLLKKFVQHRRRWFVPALFAVVCVLLCGLGSWLGSIHAMQQMRRTLVSSRIAELQGSASHVVRLIEADLRETKSVAADAHPTDNRLTSSIRHVDTSPIDGSAATFWALVGEDARILGHSQQAESSAVLEKSWYDVRLARHGGNVFATTSNALTEGRKAIVVRLPVVVDDETVAELYHGFYEAAVDRQLDEARPVVLMRWAVAAAACLALVGGAAVVAWLTQRRLTRFAALGADARRGPIAPLVAGLAHEIRNPLHAIRLNLHALAQSYRTGRQDRMDESDVATIVGEASREIDRLESLMRQVLGYASPPPAANGGVDANAEINAALGFIRRSADEKRIVIAHRNSSHPALVGIHRDRLRQTMLNLLENACEAAGEGGHVHVTVDGRGKTVEVTIADDGPGVAVHLRQQIFDPFFSTKSHGTGLGLALARHYVEQAGGRIVCEPRRPRGTAFRVELPRA